MPSYRDAIADFLAQERIAVVGVSRDREQTANVIYRALREAGYTVLAVNPNATEVEADVCYSSLAAIPGGADAVLVVTRADVSAGVVRECADLGVGRVWLHRSFGEGSVSAEALEVGRREGLSVIPGGCPMMFRDGADFGHKCMRFVLNATGKLFAS